MIRLVLIFLLLFSRSVQAETIAVVSGEHETFSRLVLDIPPGAIWRLGRVGIAYALEMDPVHDFDVTSVFDRIGRNRLATITPVEANGRLVLNMACDCHAGAFLFRADKLVIDIIDGPASAGSQFETALDGNQPRQEAILPLFAAAVPDAPSPEHALLPDPLADRGAVSARVSAAESAVLESLARAASQGLLDLDLPLNPEPPTAAPERSVSAPMPSGPPLNTIGEAATEVTDGVIAAPALAIRPGLTAQTSIDRDQRGPLAAASAAGSRCMDDSHFDLASWGGSGDFATEIAARHSALTTERDNFPDGAAEELARTYLHFGFGREAEQALGLDGNRSPNRDILRAIAQIIDNEPVSDTVFNGQAGCSRPVALWAALARGDLVGVTKPEQIAIISAHKVLPDGVRAHLTPRLAQIFLDADEAETAQDILATGQSNDETGALLPTSTVSAAVTREIEGTQAAISALEGLAADDSRLTPDALVSLFDLSILEGRPIPDDLISLAAAMRFENRGTDAEMLLGQAEFRALMANDRFDAALSLLEDDLVELPAEARATLWTDLITGMADRMPNAPFLEVYFDGLPEDISPRAANSVARRLLDLGFADQAAALIAGPAFGDDMGERRYLRAEAAFSLGDADAGIQFLAGMTDPRAAALRAQYTVPEQGSTAPDAIPGNNPQDLWRAGAWGRLELQEDPLLQAASAAMLTDATVPEPNSTLASRQNLLDDASATRRLANDLLSRFALDPADDPPAGN